MKQLHQTQLQILKKLLFATSLRYGELKPTSEMENNQFDFHLDQLIMAQYIRKMETGYLLTAEGKEYANRMDTEEVTIAKQAKVSVVIIPVKYVGKKKYYLIYTRLKQPFYGCQGFASGKVRFGEKIEEAAERELEEETGLTGTPKIIIIKHYRVFQETTNQLVEDKIMFFYLFEDPKGEIRPHNEGLYEWVEKKDVFSYVNNHFVGMDVFKEDITMIDSFDGSLQIKEIDQFTSKF